MKVGIKFLKRIWSEGLELEFEMQGFTKSVKRHEGGVRSMGKVRLIVFSGFRMKEEDWEAGKAENNVLAMVVLRSDLRNGLCGRLWQRIIIWKR